MVPKPLQKLGGNSKKSPRCVHSGDSTGDCEIISSVSYILTLIKAYSIYVCTHITWFFYPLTSVGDEWEDERLHSGPRSTQAHGWNHAKSTYAKSIAYDEL